MTVQIPLQDYAWTYRYPRRVTLWLLILISLLEVSSGWMTMLVSPPKLARNPIFGCHKSHSSNRLEAPSSSTLPVPVQDEEGPTPTIPILYESDRLLILHKPTGIAHHDDENENGKQLGIVHLIQQQQSPQRLWGVHRLDRVTSGILVMAKDAAMASHLTKSFAQQEIQKVYFGMSAKRPTKKKQGWVQGGMVRSRDKSWILTRDSKSNFAKTRFFTANVNVNVHVDDDSTTNTTTTRKYTAILFRPYTGKTHQLRVAAKAMGIPLLGDPIYKDGIDHYHNNNNDNDDDIPTITRTYLHASGTCIPALDGHASVTVWSPPPFEALLGDDDDEDDSMMTNVVQKLMIKHCDVPSLVEAMMEG